MIDIDLCDELLQRLTFSELEWLEIRIRRRKESMHPEWTVRKTIIKQEQ